jgi:putative SOS response-associated peptidase YedK
MCGRYTLRERGLLAKLVYQDKFEEFSDIRIVPSFSLSPGTPVPIIRFNQAKKRVLGVANWGLVPFWSKTKPTDAPINAVSETVAGKPMFREPFKRRRCLMPADGFYEPKGPKTLKKRQPYFFQRPDRDVFAFAGLWDRWKSPDGQTLETCVLLTTTPNELLQPIHDRMPVIVEPKDYDRWLDRDVLGEEVEDILKPSSEALETWRVLDMVNDPDTNKGIRPGVKDP